MTEVLPEPIQSIIVQYTFEDFSLFKYCILEVDIWKWYNSMLKVPRTFYFENSSYEYTYWIYDKDIIKWMIDEFEPTKQEYIWLFRTLCDHDSIEGMSLIKTKGNLIKEDFDTHLSYQNLQRIYSYHYREHHEDVTDFIEKEFGLTSEEINKFRSFP